MQRRELSLNDLISGSLELLRTAVGPHIEIKIVAAPDLAPAFVDPIHLDRVLMNLCLNARDAMPGGGTLTIETSNAEIGGSTTASAGMTVSGSYVVVAVTDEGMGMDAATLDRLFEPFFTTKEVGKGSGLGLATVYGIVK